MTTDDDARWEDAEGEFKAYIDSDGDICIVDEELDYDIAFTPEDWDSMCDFIAQQRALRFC